MNSRDDVFSKGTRKPGRYGSLGNTDLANIKKMLAEDLDTQDEQRSSSKPPDTSPEDVSVHTSSTDLVDESPLGKPKKRAIKKANASDTADSGRESSLASLEEESMNAKALQRLNVEVDATLHSQFKAMVGLRKTTMRQVVESFMTKYVDEVKREFFPS